MILVVWCWPTLCAVIMWYANIIIIIIISMISRIIFRHCWYEIFTGLDAVYNGKLLNRIFHGFAKFLKVK